MDSPKSTKVKESKRYSDKSTENKEFEEKVLEIARITRVVKGGRRLRFRAAVVIGNKNGRVGFGIAKASEVQKAIQKAITQAKKNLITVQITEKNHSIPYISQANFTATTVLLKPASTGTSLIAGSSVRAVLSLAGYQNIVSKTIGSTSHMNTAYATIKCLEKIANRSTGNKKNE